jgi:hypothetical protein
MLHAISSVPLGRRTMLDSGFHGLRSARRAAGFAPPVATILRPFGTRLGYINTYGSMPQVDQL